MPQDESTLPEGAATYTETEEHALTLAAELRNRVQRERATVAKLQAYLAATRHRRNGPRGH